MRLVGLAILAIAMSVLGGNAAWAADVYDPSANSYHASPDRSGRYTIPGLTWTTAHTARLDTSFDAHVDGQVYAQPLYWRPAAGMGVLIVATEANSVVALDAKSGREVWRRSVGQPARRAALPCGDINPLGITGTPVIDPTLRSVYLDAMVNEGGNLQHLVFGLSLDDGSIWPGWPINVGVALRGNGVAFAPAAQNQRGALTVIGNRLYVPFGGHFGDCGDYHGMVVGLQVNTPQVFGAWETRAPKGGIWAPGGITSDGRSLFVATGNTQGARDWGDGEAVIRLRPDLQHSTDTRDFFTPANWRQLDDEDLDLGGVDPLPIDVPSTHGPVRLLLALGKDGKAYLLDRDNLGGIGRPLLVEQVANQRIITAPASYRVGNAVFVAFEGRELACPEHERGASLAVLRITANPQLEMHSAWCGSFDGRGSPIVTTSDGTADPIVWVVGAEGDQQLHGFRGDTGELLSNGGGDRMAGVRRFSTILAADGRFYVAGDGKVFAFRFTEGAR